MMRKNLKKCFLSVCLSASFLLPGLAVQASPGTAGGIATGSTMALLGFVGSVVSFSRIGGAAEYTPDFSEDANMICIDNCTIDASKNYELTAINHYYFINSTDQCNKTAHGWGPAYIPKGENATVRNIMPTEREYMGTAWGRPVAAFSVFFWFVGTSMLVKAAHRHGQQNPSSEG